MPDVFRHLPTFAAGALIGVLTMVVFFSHEVRNQRQMRATAYDQNFRLGEQLTKQQADWANVFDRYMQCKRALQKYEPDWKPLGDE